MSSLREKMQKPPEGPDQECQYINRTNTEESVEDYMKANSVDDPLLVNVRTEDCFSVLQEPDSQKKDPLVQSSN